MESEGKFDGELEGGVDVGVTPRPQAAVAGKADPRPFEESILLVFSLYSGVVLLLLVGLKLPALDILF
jgi:hypothetical protein